ncbi:cation diffusion facilitator family transporter [Fictibacillus sp. WQ 8-8]|uniref:cation diffusion facilitator family transporter n=1 Tax=unclassified Fictibacillus TaxID=2644029 RepID=UPI0008EF9997|nr:MULTISPECIES: cation diffusion facilitator family transporter [unclassified Fictibacillus]MCQ6268016.1 cation diffusion facilitator family transporter [Fictibacillus sp. WQ 8-8]MED2971249.1 cation diffusion facilitator family transporter [Fictibacillus sp. B-59209]SFD51047.1 cobalt-zinc-cadmium efflux system protein [Bacillus sp. OV194]
MADYDYHHLPHVKVQSRSKKTLWITLLLTLFFTIVEVIGGLISNSLALLSDSAHMVSDVLALSLSMLAIYLATRQPNAKFTFGFLRFEIIASFLNGLALAIIAIGIFIEGIKRFIKPETIDFKLMLIIAVIGFTVNLVLTIVLSRSMKEEENLNVKSALWHFIGDLLSSIGVIISAILIKFTDLYFFDPLISLIIGGIIFTGGYKIIKESYMILMESVPEGLDLEAIRADIYQVEGVEDVHELHLWTVTSDHHSLTAHVFINENIQPFCVILAINEMLKDKYKLKHTTVQIEHATIHHHGEYGKQFLETHKS